MTAPRSAAPTPTEQDRAEARALTFTLLPKNTAMSEGDWSLFWMRLAEVRATARREGFRAGIESAAKLCDSYVGDSDGGIWQDAAMVTRDKLARDIRALSPDAGGESGQPRASVSPGGEDATGGGA